VSQQTQIYKLLHERRSLVVQQPSHPPYHARSSLLPFYHTYCTFYHIPIPTMNSSDQLAHQMSRITISSDDIGCSSSVPPSLEMLLLSAQMMAEAQEFQLDCSRFQHMTPCTYVATSPDGSFGSSSSGSSLARSNCVSNLSTLGSPTLATSMARSSKQVPQCVSAPNERSGWGYFVDSQDR